MLLLITKRKYPNTWYTLQNLDDHIFYKDKSGYFYTAIVGYGYYETIQDLIKAVNKALAKDLGNGNIVLSSNALTGKVKVQLKSGYELYVNGKMSIILGFGGKKTKITKTMESPYEADLQRIMTIYVYSDIVQPQIVGDTSAKLLKTFRWRESTVTSSLKRSQTYSTFRFKPNRSKTWKSF